ncbi:Cd(II)/Pb(II)-responsive transcriptional regulator [Denitromonas iodatirespirans]|uniref:Cd(II)/Pb(II)-responsive transcriptional regulator n=1 Tax=Denitromonas iodatirespirans TaxID=2795389 RepID=A0A944DL29_DENI1|nr:Cd(II)/Pb(II)-responsive transcriptional regulator [Denitromonas iodatirespirans]MBT0960694.1 Cd(II)/Pb(II)-responsive transcriptional regulator [Denitromonas iodatirespirans]
MRIGELARACGVDVETVRYYEKQGLLPAAHRTPNGYRLFGPQHAERLAFIRHCRALDMPLAEIRHLIEVADHPDADCGDVNALIDTQLDKVRERIKAMQALEHQLVALRSRCDSQRAVEACGILNELMAVSRTVR